MFLLPKLQRQLKAEVRICCSLALGRKYIQFGWFNCCAQCTHLTRNITARTIGIKWGCGPHCVNQGSLSVRQVWQVYATRIVRRFRITFLTESIWCYTVNFLRNHGRKTSLCDMGRPDLTGNRPTLPPEKALAIEISEAYYRISGKIQFCK
jgi:hypothetical protein